MKDSDKCDYEDIDKQIGERICFLRKNVYKLSCDEFAQLIGISRFRLSRIENGKIRVPAFIIRKLAVDMNISVNWILCISDT